MDTARGTAATETQKGHSRMTTTETPNDARHYAAGIARELAQWEAAADGDPDALAALADDRADADEPATVAEYLNTYALDVEVLRDENRERVLVEIVRTYGGPSCRIEWDSRYPAAFEIVTHWGGDAWRMTVHAPTLGDQLAEIYA